MLPQQKKALCSYSSFVIVVLVLLAINIHKPIKTLTVSIQPQSTTYYYTGVATPIHTSEIVSPIEGIVEKIYLAYGEKVIKGQKLFAIRSTTQTEDTFFSALETFLKAKSSYKNAQFKDKGNAELYKSGLLSKIAYMDSQDQVQNAKLAEWTAKQSFQKLLGKIKIPISLFEDLTVERIPEVEPIIKRAMKEVTLVSPDDGELLFPAKSLGNQESDVKTRLKVGNLIKAEQPLGIVSNMKGLQVEINILETNFHDIHKGDNVTITAQAIPGVTLMGKIYSINSQASNTEANSTPTYTAFVRVPHLTRTQRDLIEVGMSLEIALTKIGQPVIKIPLGTLIEKKDGYWAKIYLKKDQKIIEKKVTPGITDQDSVVITSGLSVGDEIVLPH